MVSNSRAAYFRQRYANLWLFARLRGVYEPAAFLLMSVWLSYSSWETAQHHFLEAAILGSILGASFLVTLFLLLMGLVAGGRWRAKRRDGLGGWIEAPDPDGLGALISEDYGLKAVPRDAGADR